MTPGWPTAWTGEARREQSGSPDREAAWLLSRHTLVASKMTLSSPARVWNIESPDFHQCYYFPILVAHKIEVQQKSNQLWESRLWALQQGSRTLQPQIFTMLLLPKPWDKKEMRHTKNDVDCEETNWAFQQQSKSLQPHSFLMLVVPQTKMQTEIMSNKINKHSFKPFCVWI